MTEKNGTVTSSLTTEENRRFLTWLHQLWEEKLLDENGFTITDSMRQVTETGSFSMPFSFSTF